MIVDNYNDKIYKLSNYQAFYNTKIIEVISKLIGGVDMNEQLELKKMQMKLQSKKNSRRNSNSTSNNSNENKNNNNDDDDYNDNDFMEGLINSSLYQINIPDGLESRTYGALYRLLAKRKQIPLGTIIIIILIIIIITTIIHYSDHHTSHTHTHLYHHLRSPYFYLLHLYHIKIYIIIIIVLIIIIYFNCRYSTWSVCSYTAWIKGKQNTLCIYKSI